MILTPGIDEVRAAAERIRPYVRQTPLLRAAPTKERPELARGLRLKLEALQVTASGGNHGLAVAYAGWAAEVPATIFLPRSVAAEKIAKLDAWGARVVMAG